MEYIGAIFDQDGLLFDTERIFQLAWLESASEQGVAIDPLFPRTFCGKPQSLIAEISKKAYPALDVEKYCKRAVDLAWSRQLSSVPEKKPGLLDMLEFCRANGVKTAVASSSTIKVIEHNLVSSGIRDYIDAIAYGEEVEHGKPAPDIFLLAAKRLGIAPRCCCVFEDAISGILGAWEAGCRAVMIPDLVEPNAEVFGKCLVYPSLSAARAAFDKS